MAIWTIAIALIVVLSAADPALAWGPATHVGLANSILERLGLLPAAVAAILSRYGVAYVYGNIAADIVFAKRWSRVKQFCHHWSTAFGLLDKAEDDRAKAFALGYLSHLAADTVAHGKYVPRQIVISECSMSFGHLYWELRADSAESALTWSLLKNTLQRNHNDHHLALAGHITDTFLPFDFNRMLFRGVSALSVRPGFRRTVDAWSRCSRWYLSPKLLEGYRAESIDRIRSILAEGDRSSLLREDPNGTSALMQVRVHRRQVRRMKRGG